MRISDWSSDVCSSDLQLRVRTGADDSRPENIALTMAIAAPGNATRRYDGVAVHWRPPVNGRGPWLALDNYYDRKPQRPFGDDPKAWFSRLPGAAGPRSAGLSPAYFWTQQLYLE